MIEQMSEQREEATHMHVSADVMGFEGDTKRKVYLNTCSKAHTSASDR